MGKGGRYLKNNGKKPAGKGKKIALIIVSVLLVLIVAAVIVGVVFYNSMLNKLSRAEVQEKDYTMSQELEQMMGIMETEETTASTETVEETAEETEASEEIAETEEVTETVASVKEADVLNVLVVGQAARENEEYRMADTMILVTVNKDTKVVTLTSFLRDTYLKLPDYMGHTCGKNRLNVCYHLGWTFGDTGGAMEMTNLCLLNNFGIEVDYDVEIDFNAFKQIIEVLGGVRITLTEAEAAYLNDEPSNWQEVTAGENRLYGDAALAYARMRKAEGDSDSDIKRTERQRTLLTAIFNKLKSKGISGVRELADEILPMITTNMTNAEITSCLLDLLPLLSEMTIETGTCPISGSYWGEVIDLFDVPSSVLKYDEGQNRKYMTALTEGTVLTDTAAK